MGGIKIAIAAGGTGGHLYPALSIAEELERQGVEKIEFFGTARGPEAKVVPQKGYPFHKIWIKGYPRRLKPEVFLLPLKLIVSVLQCLTTLTRFWPHCLVATGGYVCLPFMTAGKLLGMPLVIHEQNSLPGLTTRIGAMWARTIFYSFPGSERHFRGRGEAVLSGNPVKAGLGAKDKAEAKASLGLNQSKRTILVFGGSQGAETLNRAVSAAADELCAEFNLIWGTGKGKLPVKRPENAVVREFFDDMDTVYSAADLAVCRAGAMTLAEIAAAGLPAILVPFPYAAEDHQRLNALPLVEKGAASMALDKDFTGKALLKEVGELMSNPGRLEEMSQKIKMFHNPNSAAVIVEKILKTAAEKSH